MGRVSQGAGSAILGKGGLGYIARRGIDFGTSVSLQSVEGVARLASQQPLELLSMLPDLVPEVGLAAWNSLRLGCSPGTVRIKAMTLGANGESEEAPDGTAAINNLFDNLPDEVGSFEDALAKNFLSVLFSGMCATEGVPGPRNQGLAAVYPVNPLTLRFKRETTGELALYQRQTSDASGLGSYAAGLGGFYEPLPMESFFWSSLDAFPDDPYGRAVFAPALTEVLRMLAFINDLSLAFHRLGSPRHDVGFDFEMWAQLARDVIGMTDPVEIDKWVQKKFAEAQAFFQDMEVDDAFFHDLKSKVGVLGVGNAWPDFEAMFDILRYRLIIALKQNPVLMGFVNGSTETWSDVQWEIYSKGMQTLVKKAAQPLLRCAQLHLRLLGKPYTAICEFEPIRSIQRLEDAQAEAAEIANEARKRDEGWQEQDTSSMALTGSAAVADAPIVRSTSSDNPKDIPPVPGARKRREAEMLRRRK